MASNITFSTDKTGSLAGHLLIATPVIQESCFARSVVYICAHNEEGAMGVIINSPVDSIDIKDILSQLDIDSASAPQEFPVHFGGPVEASRGFILHSSDYATADSLVQKDGIAVTASISILQEMAHGKSPAQGMLILGYSGWSPGQLESEIEGGSWIVVPASKQLVFNTDNEAKWNVALSTLGIDMGHFSTVVGHA